MDRLSSQTCFLSDVTQSVVPRTLWYIWSCKVGKCFGGPRSTNADGHFLARSAFVSAHANVWIQQTPGPRNQPCCHSWDSGQDRHNADIPTFWIDFLFAAFFFSKNSICDVMSEGSQLPSRQRCDRLKLPLTSTQTSWIREWPPN